VGQAVWSSQRTTRKLYAASKEPEHDLLLIQSLSGATCAMLDAVMSTHTHTQVPMSVFTLTCFTNASKELHGNNMSYRLYLSLGLLSRCRLLSLPPLSLPPLSPSPANKVNSFHNKLKHLSNLTGGQIMNIVPGLR